MALVGHTEMTPVLEDTIALQIYKCIYKFASTK